MSKKKVLLHSLSEAQKLGYSMASNVEDKV
jgi:hypothetical protein